MLAAMSEWSETLVSSFAASIRKRRQELDLRAQDVADRTAALGHPLNRYVISDLENGRRKDRLMIGDALVIAEALRVPLGYLLFPNQPDGEVEAYPGVTISSYVASRSLHDGMPLTDDELVPTGDGHGHYVKDSDRAGEVISGHELPGAVRGLMKAREDLREAQNELDAARERGDMEGVTAYRKRIEWMERHVEMYAANVRRLGGVVDGA